MSKRFFLSGIGTGVGKTITAAALCNTFQWAYWKPVQAGDLDASDTITMRSLSPNTTCFPEQFQLQMAASPHLAAAHEHLSLDFTQFQVPETTHTLLIEGAGGLLAPMSDSLRMVDCVQAFNAPLILVIDFYLGSLNHTLLSFDYIYHHKIPVFGVVYNRLDANFEWLRKQHDFHEIGRVDNSQHLARIVTL